MARWHPQLPNAISRSLTVARDLLTQSGSIFVQIGDENVHLVRAVMDEVFGIGNCVSFIVFKDRRCHRRLSVRRLRLYPLVCGSKESLKYRAPLFAKSWRRSRRRTIHLDWRRQTVLQAEKLPRKNGPPRVPMVAFSVSTTSPVKVRQGQRGRSRRLGFLWNWKAGRSDQHSRLGGRPTRLAWSGC